MVWRPGPHLALLSVLALLLLVPPAGGATVTPPPVDATAALVATRDGNVLWQRGARRRLPMASITKLMTTLVVLDRARPSQRITVGPAAATVGESSIFLSPGERLTVRDLLSAALIQSANDAAVALAEGVGKGDVDRFVGWMNARAQRMGLRDTHFANPDGLDESGHYSSARDLLKLARVAMRKPIVRRIVRHEHAEIAGGRTLTTWNDLLGTYPGVYGVKTGHTGDAGWCEVAVARRDGAVVYAVILGAPGRAGRNADLAELLTWGLDHYARTRLVRGGATYASAAVPFEDEKLRLVAARPMRAVVRVDRPLVEKVVAPASVSAPVTEGARLGSVRVTQGGRVLASVPLVAARSVEELSFGRKVGWYAGRALDEAGGMLTGIFG